MITNRLITQENVAFSRDELKNAENQNKKRMFLLEKQANTGENKQEKSEKTVENGK